MKVLALDPGDTCGWCILSRGEVGGLREVGGDVGVVADDWELRGVDQVNWRRIAEIIRAFLESLEYGGPGGGIEDAAVIVEDFRLRADGAGRAQTGRRMRTSEVIGRIEQVVEDWALWRGVTVWGNQDRATSRGEERDEWDIDAWLHVDGGGLWLGRVQPSTKKASAGHMRQAGIEAVGGGEHARDAEVIAWGWVMRRQAEAVRRVVEEDRGG